MSGTGTANGAKEGATMTDVALAGVTITDERVDCGCTVEMPRVVGENPIVPRPTVEALRTIMPRATSERQQARVPHSIAEVLLKRTLRPTDEAPQLRVARQSRAQHLG